jgi:2-hydroxychromene-2-carboxylate isomerase
MARRVLPRAVVALSRLDARGRLSAAARRRLGRRGRVELFFAFDDAASALALLDLSERLAGRPVALVLRPVVRRGIPDDPALDLKRRHAIADVRRRAPRLLGAPLARTQPLAPEGTAFLAEWVATGGPGRLPFAVAAMRRLWFESDGPVSRSEYAALWGSVVGGEPPPDGASAVRRSERLMRRRRPYDTPAAWIHGQWFFAHDRLPQIAARLDDLGWR